MNLLPQASGMRPRVACDISAHGVVAARSDGSEAPLAAVSRVELRPGAVVPSLKPGNVVDRVEVVDAVRKALEAVGMKPNTRAADVSLVVPDSAVRVSMLDFDALPTKLTEALPLVRFRLKKMLPFDADDAMVSFQTMSTSKSLTRVLAVAIPRDVLGEYEGAVREAGYEPGAVIPSTLAALAAMEEDPALVVNANEFGVTSAIVRDGILMLHRSVDLQMEPVGTPANLPPELFEESPTANEFAMLPLVDVHDSAGEWAMQEAMPEHGRNPYADRVADEAAVQGVDGITDMTQHHAFYENVSGQEDFAQKPIPQDLGDMRELPKVALHEEIAQAVSVAVAYFEDTLAMLPEAILSAGPLGAGVLNDILNEQDTAHMDGPAVRELVRSDAIAADAAGVPRGWLSGVRGALRS